MAGTVTDFFNSAWSQYLAQHPGADKMQWFAANGTNLQNYYNTLAAQHQPSASPPPAAARPSYGNLAGDFDANGVEAALQAIMAKNPNMTHDQAIVELQKPQYSSQATDAKSGLPQNPAYDTGIAKDKLNESIRAAQAAEEQARQQLAYQKGVSTGKVDGTNTMESVKYGNEMLANPQNVALSEQIRKGYALGDKPGQTVADYLNRTVDNPVSTIERAPLPHLLTGGPVPIPGFEGGTPGDYYGFGSNEEAARFAAAMQGANQDQVATVQRLAADPVERANALHISRLLAENSSAPPPAPPPAAADFTATKPSEVTNPNKVGWQEPVGSSTPDDDFSKVTAGITADSNIGPEPTNQYSLRDDPNYSFILNDANYNFAKKVWDAKNYAKASAPSIGPYTGIGERHDDGPDGAGGSWFHGQHWVDGRVVNRAYGGQVTVGGEPHWIVDNSGAPVAALSEDGKKEQVKGKSGVEVVPLDPKRHAVYEAKKKNVPGLLNGGKVGQRQAPSRRPGSTSGNSSRTQSGTRATLPDGSVANTSVGVGDGRQWNGAKPVNAPGASNIGQVGTDKDAQGVRPGVKGAYSDLAAQVQQKIQANGPVPVKVTPGASYMPNNPAGGPLAPPVNHKVDMTATGVTPNPQATVPRPVYGQPVGIPAPVSAPVNPAMLAQYRAGISNAPVPRPVPQWNTLATPIPGRAMGGPVDYAPIGNAQVQSAEAPAAAPAPIASPAPASAAPAPVGDPSLTPILVQIAMQYGLTDQTGQPDLARAKQLYDLNPSMYSDDGGGGVVRPTDAAAPQGPMASPPISAAPVAIPGRAVGGAIGIPQNEVVQPTASPLSPRLVTARPPAPTFIGSGGARTIGNNVASSRFGFDAGAPTDIAGQNQRYGVKNNPGVFVQAAWKWNPATLRNMTTQDRTALESQIRATGQDPASFYDQAKYAEPGSATSGRAFY